MLRNDDRIQDISKVKPDEQQPYLRNIRSIRSIHRSDRRILFSRDCASLRGKSRVGQATVHDTIKGINADIF